MDNNHVELATRFPELQDAEGTMMRIAEAFVAPEYARAAFGLIRGIVSSPGRETAFGNSVVITAPEETIILTIGRWWLLNFHIAPAESLEEGDDAEPLAPGDYPEILEREKEKREEEAEEDTADAAGNGIDFDDEDDDDEDELIEATFYQVGAFLLDSTIIPHETIFEREDLDCYAYDFQEEKVSAERFYLARMVWEPEDLQNEDLKTAIYSAAEFLVTAHGDDMEFAEHHDPDFAQLVLNEALCERVIAATDFGDVIVVEGNGE